MIANRERRAQSWIGTCKRWLNKTLPPYILLFPAMFVVIWVLGISVLESFTLSLHQYEFMIIGDRTFVGIDNYLSLFRNAAFQNSVRVTVIFVFGTLVLGLILSLLFAMALHQLAKRQRFFCALALVPYLVSGVAVGAIWRFLFSGRAGLINLILQAFNQPSVPWLSNPTLALIVLIMATAWQRAPVSTLLILSGLQNMDRHLFEAAEIDGAKPRQVFRYITLPLLKPVLGIAIVWLNFVAFSMFDIVLAMTRGGPGRATELMAVRMFHLSFEQFDVPGGAAILIILLAINLTISALVLKFFKV